MHYNSKRKNGDEILMLIFDAVNIVLMNFKPTSFKYYFYSGCGFETVLIGKQSKVVK